jgi:hypothetical protein
MFLSKTFLIYKNSLQVWHDLRAIEKIAVGPSLYWYLFSLEKAQLTYIERRSCSNRAQDLL